MSTQSLKISLQASSLALGELEHPNRMPFQGLMTWLNSPSDKPVGGAGGKRVVIPTEHGVAGLASLKGMAVNFDSVWMDKHVSTNKVGVIEDCWTGEPNEDGAVPVYVSGYIYAHDFPEEAKQIKEEQAYLGFSYETIDTPVTDGVFQGESVLFACADVVFSGAAILLKQKAAYTNTSLVANADENKEETNLNIEEIVKAVVEAMEAKYSLTAKADEKKEDASEEDVKEKDSKEEEKESDDKKEEDSKEEKTEEEASDDKKEDEESEDDKKSEDKTLKAEAEEVEEKVDFKAMAEDFKSKYEALEAKFEKMEADLKAEADSKEQNTHKGFAYPTTLVSKYNLEASADTYESKIAAVDARADLNTEEKMALKFELRAQELKSQK